MIACNHCEEECRVIELDESSDDRPNNLIYVSDCCHEMVVECIQGEEDFWVASLTIEELKQIWWDQQI